MSHYNLCNYMVVGVYADNDYQRFATVVEANDPLEAEHKALEEAAEGDLVIAAVFEMRLNGTLQPKPVR